MRIYCVHRHVLEIAEVEAESEEAAIKAAEQSNEWELREDHTLPPHYAHLAYEEEDDDED